MSDGAFRSNEEFVDLTYRGLQVAQRARLLPDGPDGAFVEHEAPLPVGARVTLVRDGRPPTEARVVGVVELEAGAKSAPGMRLSWGAAKPAAAAEDARDTNVMAAVIEPVEEGVPESQEPHDTVVMAAVPEPVDDSGDRSGPSSPDESTPGGSRRSRRNKRKPNGR